MLSDREKRWIKYGGLSAFYLIYLWGVLFPLMGYHWKMRERIARSWNKVRRLELELEDYARVYGSVQGLVRRAISAGQKIPPETQLGLLVQNTLSLEKVPGAVKFKLVWEGKRVVVKRGTLKLRVTPAQAFSLIRRIDRSYLPMRVVAWDLKRTGGHGYVLTAEVYLLEARKRP